MSLQTNLTHITSEPGLDKMIGSNSNVMICCGRMGPMCVPVYRAMTELENSYPHVRFCDMSFDDPVAFRIRELPECSGFMGLPFTVYFHDGKVVRATSSIQSKEQVRAILDEHFAK